MRFRQYLACFLLAFPGLGLISGCSLFSGDDSQEVDEVVEEDADESTTDNLDAAGENVDSDRELSEDLPEDETASEADAISDTDESMEPAAPINDMTGLSDLGSSDSIGTTPSEAIPNDLSGLTPTPSPELSAPTIPMAPAAMTMDSNLPKSNPSPEGAQIFYVSESRDIMDSANGSQVVGRVNKGDPVLARKNGDWAEILNRGWIKANDLSDRPVGRAKPKRTWN